LKTERWLDLEIENITKVVTDFNRGLQEMLDDGTFDKIVKKFGYDELR
jgi:ABC-type amino acid transport substrate-binding protein